MQKKTVLVLGATGQQGGAVARHLLAGGWPVRALTRDTTSAKAAELVRLGAELVCGDLEDRASIEAAMRGVYGVFSVQPPAWSPTPASNAEEARMGKLAADAAKRAGVQHFVYTSVAGAEAQAQFREMPKWEIEQHIRSLGLTSTILRPAAFMENFTAPFSGIQKGVFAHPTRPDVVMQLIAVDDIGAFAALALNDPGTFAGRTIELAGDGLTPPEIAAAISRAAGRSIPYVHIPLEEIRKHNAIIARLYQWLNEDGYEVNIPAARRMLPGLTTFDTWLERTGKAGFEELFRGEQT